MKIVLGEEELRSQRLLNALEGSRCKTEHPVSEKLILKYGYSTRSEMQLLATRASHVRIIVA